MGKVDVCKTIICFVVITSILTLAGCSVEDSNTSALDEKSESIDTQSTNTGFIENNNIYSNGMAGIQGEWIYYSNWNDGGRLYRVKTDGSEEERINHDSVSNINVVGGWIYCCNESDSNRLYKISLDGSSKQMLTENSVYSVYVIGEWIFYRSGNCIYKIKTDGEDENCLYGINTSGYFFVTSQWIYYLQNGDNAFYRAKPDGSQVEKVTDELISEFQVLGDWVYYIKCSSNANDNSRIFKMKLDGTCETRVNSDVSHSINVDSNGWIYYSNYSDGFKLFKIRCDGSEKTKINDENSQNLNIAGDWIYYTSNGPYGDEQFRIKKDGSGKEKISKKITEGYKTGGIKGSNNIESSNKVMGNTNSNLRNSGIAAIQNGWIYYNNSSDNNALYRVKENGALKEKICDDNPKYINVVGERVYYSFEGSIYSIKTNGQDRKILEEGPAFQIHVVDDTIFYITNSDSYGNIYKMSTDGTRKEKIGKDYTGSEPVGVENFSIIGDFIYYTDFNKNFFRVRVDGTDITRIPDIKTDIFLFDKDSIYFNSWFDRWTLNKADFLSERKFKLTEDIPISINQGDEWIYYIDMSRESKMYRIKKDGSQKEIIVNEVRAIYNSINVVGDWIYYIESLTRDLRPIIYRMKLDGSERRQVD